MPTSRLEAFSDGVIAILITIMVLEFKVPHGGATIEALRPLLPTFLVYILSFIYLGIYWSNHHHLFHATDHVTGGILWANLHLLFWLSLVPFATSWMGENYASTPSAIYGGVLLGAGIAYGIMVRVILRNEPPHSTLRQAIGSDAKGNVSILLYVLAIPLAFVRPVLSSVVYVTVAIIWLVPDRRIERTVSHT